MTRTAEPRSRVVPVILLALAGVLAWRVITLGMADHFARTDPARALEWRSQHPRALLTLADETAADPAQADQARALAQRAVRANPLNGRPYRVLGQLEADPAKQAALFGIASARAPRDPLSHTWLIDHHLREGRFAEAIAHADLLMRVQGRVAPDLHRLALGLAGSPEAYPLLADRLLTRPPWADAVLSQLVANAPQVETIWPLMDRLRQAPGGLSAKVLAAWLDRLTREERWGQAYLAWVSQLPPERLNGLGNLYNGGFEWEPGQGGFDWRLGRLAGAGIARTDGPGVTGQAALRVSFQGRRVPFAHVRQLLALPPGAYRLSGRARAESLLSERGLVWVLACAGARPQPLAQTAPLMGNRPWAPFEVDFVVPAQGCSGQWLTLVLPARIPAEQRISGTAWFDDMRISRNPG
jgi:hypothetical protein